MFKALFFSVFILCHLGSALVPPLTFSQAETLYKGGTQLNYNNFKIAEFWYGQFVNSAGHQSHHCATLKISPGNIWGEINLFPCRDAQQYEKWTLPELFSKFDRNVDPFKTFDIQYFQQRVTDNFMASSPVGSLSGVEGPLKDYSFDAHEADYAQERVVVMEASCRSTCLDRSGKVVHRLGEVIEYYVFARLPIPVGTNKTVPSQPPTAAAVPPTLPKTAPAPVNPAATPVKPPPTDGNSSFNDL